LLGAITMILVLIFQRKSPSQISVEVGPYKLVLLSSALFSAIFVMATHMSAEYIPSGTTSIIVNLCPIVILCYAALYLRERLTTMKIFGFILGLVGGLVFLFDAFISQSGVVIGLILALIGMFAWAAYTITLDYLEGVDPYIVMTIKHTISTFIIIPFILLMLYENTQLVLILDIWTIIGLLFAGVLASGLAYVLYFSAIEILGAAKASSFLFLVPFVSVVGDFALGEPPSLLSIIAGIIAIFGVAVIRFSARQTT